MRTLRASELGSFIYCRRAWWYQRQGLSSENQSELNSGSQFHQTHARNIKLAGVYKYLALFFLTLAIALVLAQFFR
ncbi:MAG: hypothetical protein AB2L21_03460 [Anaerolineaceae bacterium]|jgi:hypothetical protein